MSECEPWPPEKSAGTLAVLCSGGVDSAVLLAEALPYYAAVQPIYIRTGSRWEDVERQYLSRFLDAVASSRLRPLVSLTQPVDDLYGSHWCMTGNGVPDQNSPDEAVYLPGRNVLLLAKSLLWCHLNGVPEIAMAPLAANPFPDATPAFFDGFAAMVNTAVDGHVCVRRPYAHLKKADVLRRVPGLPWQHTFSCISPIEGLHCGRCNKCAERRQAFAAAGVTDPTPYSNK